MYEMQSAPGAETIINGKPYLYFAGTGYYGLQGNPQVLQAASEALFKYGIASATSRGGYGNNPPTKLVEQLAARYFGTEDAFYYVSGYVGNSILADYLRDRFDIAFVDQAAHYSVYDGLRLAGRPIIQFAHCDAEDLEQKLAHYLSPGQRPLLMTDAIFPSLGRISPLPEYLRALQAYPGAILCTDDAHATGTIGAQGRGIFEYFELPSEPVQLYFSTTLSKAIGGQGGVIVGSHDFISDLKRNSHYYNGASQPSVPVAAATAKSLELVLEQPSIRENLWANVAYARKGIRALGLSIEESIVPIISLELDKAERMQAIQQGLFDRGIAIAYQRAYTGIGPEGLLRIAIFSTHTHAMIDRLIAELGSLL